jgi:hypothetical protein
MRLEQNVNFLYSSLDQRLKHLEKAEEEEKSKKMKVLEKNIRAMIHSQIKDDRIHNEKLGINAPINF